MTRSKVRPVFAALHAATLDPATRPDELAAALTAADGLQDRHRLSEAAIYASGCRRYLLDTGASWKDRDVTPETTAWAGQSDHRYRLRSRPDGSYDAACSCGAATVVFTDGPEGETWHADHVAGRIPGQVPA